MSGSLVLTLTEDDYVAAQRLHFWSTTLSAKSLRRLFLIWAATVALLAIAFQFTSDRTANRPDSFAVMAVVLAVLLVAANIAPQLLIAGRRVRHVFRQQKSLQREIEFTWSQEGLTARDAQSRSHTPWRDYVRWRQGEAVFLFYHSDQLYQFIPRRALTPEQAEDLAACAAAIPQS